MKQVVLPILVCAGFLFALGVGVVAGWQDLPLEYGQKDEFERIMDGEIVIEQLHGNEVWVGYKLPNNTVHLVRYKSVTAILESAQGGRQRTTLYFGGGQFFVPYSIEEFNEAIEEYFTEANKK